MGASSGAGRAERVSVGQVMDPSRNRGVCANECGKDGLLKCGGCKQVSFYFIFCMRRWNVPFIVVVVNLES